MTHITEHHSEEEGEGDNGDDSGVGLSVGWDTVSINDELERLRELIKFEVGWLGNVVVVVSLNLGDTKFIHDLLDGLLLIGGSPEETDEALILPLHVVQGLVEGLLLGQEHLVDENG